MLSSHILLLLSSFFFFFFNDTATTEIYTLSLHDALPIYVGFRGGHGYCYAFEPRQLTGDANHQAAAHATRRDSAADNARPQGRAAHDLFQGRCLRGRYRVRVG